MRVKICGINDKKNALTAIAAGADAIGFLVGITHLAEDKISLDNAKEIIKQTPPFISTVAVTHLTDVDEICNIVEFLGVTTLQLHADMSIDQIKRVKIKLPDTVLIKTVHIIDSKSIAVAKNLEPYVDAILLDTKTFERLGGTGVTHDWNISSEIVKKVKKPVILAGGLRPDNIEEAIRIVRPYAIDVNSGVEINGDKDHDKIKDFIYKANKS